MPSPKRVCVFCGSSLGARPVYREAATALGRALAGRGIGLVYGGGAVGLMGVLADAVLGAGGAAIGVIPRHLEAREVAHRRLSELRVVETMHERKAMMADLSDAFVALPGGLGTLEELCEVLTWRQLGIHAKPVGLLDVGGYWDPLRAFVEHAIADRFMKPEHRALFIEASDAESLLAALERAPAVTVDKWLDRTER